MKGEIKMSNYQNIELNVKKLGQMKVEILRLEQNNLKTREKSNDAMVEAIKKIIINEVKKIY